MNSLSGRGRSQFLFSVLGIFWKEEISLLTAEKGSVREMSSRYGMVKMTFHCYNNRRV